MQPGSHGRREGAARPEVKGGRGLAVDTSPARSGADGRGSGQPGAQRCARQGQPRGVGQALLYEHIHAAVARAQTEVKARLRENLHPGSGTSGSAPRRRGQHGDSGRQASGARPRRLAPARGN